MPDKNYSANELRELDENSFVEYFMGDLHRSDIRDKIYADPEYLFSEKYRDDVIERLRLKYDDNLSLAYETEIKPIMRRIQKVKEEARKEARMEYVRLLSQIEKEKTALPHIANILLYLSAPEEAIGCLEELYHNRAQRRGYKQANIWLWCQVAKSVVPFAFAAILRIIRLSHLLDWIYKTL